MSSLGGPTLKKNSFIIYYFICSEGRYSVDAAFETALMQTHFNRIDVLQQNSFVVANNTNL